MADKILIAGAFGDRDYRFPFFEKIADALREQGAEVSVFNAFGFNGPASWAGKALERVFTLPGRLLGIDKRWMRAVLPWTAEGRRERSLLKTVRSTRPDVLIVIRGFPFLQRTLRRSRCLGVKSVVGWYVEGPLERSAAEVESHSYDRYFCIHTEIEPAYRDRIGWLPSYGLDIENFHRLRWPRSIEQRIVFVGTATPRRVRFLKALVGLPLEIWGPGWRDVPEFSSCYRGEFMWGGPLNALYNDSAIVLNLASWDGHLSGMTQRILEIPASGAFMLTDDSREARELFVPGQEMDVFCDPSDLRRQCEAYLLDGARREAVADRGHRRALSFGSFSDTAAVLCGRREAPTVYAKKMSG